LLSSSRPPQLLLAYVLAAATDGFTPLRGPRGAPSRSSSAPRLVRRARGPSPPRRPPRREAQPRAAAGRRGGPSHRTRTSLRIRRTHSPSSSKRSE
jgi:hypothetical protein